jgi:hypothetical protein
MAGMGDIFSFAEYNVKRPYRAFVEGRETQNFPISFCIPLFLLLYKCISFFLSRIMLSPGAMAHACNPSHVGGRWEDHSSRPA